MIKTMWKTLKQKINSTDIWDSKLAELLNILHTLIDKITEVTPRIIFYKCINRPVHFGPRLTSLHW